MPALNSALYDAAAGRFVCDFIQRLPTTDTGKPFFLYDWQKSAIMDFYSTMDVDEDTREQLRHYWYLYLEIPKKNGKSELAAALGIYHLFADGELNAEVYVCASDKDNAGIVFNAAVFMLTTAPWTAKMIARGELHIVDSRKLIEYRRKVATANGGSKWVVLGIMKVLSSEAYSKHGYKPSCVIFDELHAQPIKAGKPWSSTPLRPTACMWSTWSTRRFFFPTAGGSRTERHTLRLWLVCWRPATWSRAVPTSFAQT